MCFANAVLQLLLHTPAFCDLFGELGDLKGRCEARVSKTGGGATPLVDASVRLFEEFVLKEPQMRPPRQAAGGQQMEDEEEKRKNNVVDSFEPTYMYDAMKEKEQLKILLVRSHNQYALLCYRFVLTCCVKDGKHDDAEEFLDLYLDALDEELVELRTYIGTQKPASAPSVEELEEESQSAEGQTEAGKRDYAVRQ